MNGLAHVGQFDKDAEFTPRFVESVGRRVQAVAKGLLRAFVLFWACTGYLGAQPSASVETSGKHEAAVLSVLSPHGYGQEEAAYQSDDSPALVFFPQDLLGEVRVRMREPVDRREGRIVEFPDKPPPRAT